MTGLTKWQTLPDESRTDWPDTEHNMADDAFAQTVAMIHQTDPRYDQEAYFFVRDALGFATQSLKKTQGGTGKHVSGRELVGSIKAYALQEFGPMAFRVLKTWGISSTDDFGEIVFNLVESGTLGKTEEDHKEDFAGGFDFTEAFVRPFLPADQRTGPMTPEPPAEDGSAPGTSN